jgi:hypothetical protein
MSQEKKVRKEQPHYPVEVKQVAVDRVRAGASMSRVAAEIGIRGLNEVIMQRHTAP